MTASPSHLDLMAIARQVRRAVERDDADELHARLSRLRTELMDHVRAERPELDDLPGATAAVALDGQQRLLRILTETLFTPTGHNDPDACTCIVRAAEIELALHRQIELETSLLRSGPASRRSAPDERGDR